MKLHDLHNEVQTGILDYLAAHPNAMGSVEHICNGWLANEKYQHNLEQVKSAVDIMVKRGELIPRLGGDFYSL
ncbi:hypothetical protein QWY77_11225 [Thalassotalea ponticola]|uniref:hypothetical protein n=1 Tax=Thalassotalea ponticola TaxID=1523392 RepID=UPI0025B56D69|nr:hypothetical protein [Thalassotalea ponticola]MDN3653313.1 hypothetical protein [Thalassotalea ponticola]